MSSSTSGDRRATGGAAVGHVGRRAEARGAGLRSAHLAAFYAALEGGCGAHEALAAGVEELGRALGCVAVITAVESPAIIRVLASARRDELGDLPGDFLTRAAERLARRRRALALHANGDAAAAGLPTGRHYLGVPIPPADGSRLAVHLLSSSPFPPAARRAARAAAERLGTLKLATGLAASPEAAPPASLDAGGLGASAGAHIEQPLTEAVRAAAEALGADTCSLMMTAEGRGALVLEAAWGLDCAVTKDPRSGASIADYVMSAGQPVILADPLQDARLEGLGIEPRREIRSSICVPIALRDGLRGVVSFNRTEIAEPFAYAELQVGCTIAAQLGRCVASARQCRQGEAAQPPTLHGAAHESLREELEALYRLLDGVQRINVSFEPDGIIAQAAQCVALLTGCRSVGVAPLDWTPSPAGTHGPELEIPWLALSAAAASAARALGSPLVLREPLRTPSHAAALLAAEIGAQTGEGASLVLPCDDGQGALAIIAGWGLSREPSERELALAAGLCAHAAAGLRKAIRRQEAVSQRSLELSALYQLCGEISAATTFESALHSVLEMARSMVSYDEGLVLIWNEDTSRLELAACQGAEFDAVRAQAPQEQPGNMYQWVFAEGKAFISTDIGQPPAGARRMGQVLRSSMVLPLVVGNETIGVLAIHSALPRAYTEEHVKVLSIVASQAAAIYRALQSLGRLSRYTDKILQSIVAGVIGLDRSGRVVMWSPAAAQILGCAAAEAVGAEFARLAQIAGRDDGGLVARAMEELALVARGVLAHGVPALEHELQLEREGRPPRFLRADCTPLRDGDGQLVGAVLLVEDVTARKRLQDHMRQMSQLAAVGHLAANVAHEIRNPLSAIKTAAQFLSTEYGDEALIAQFSGIINEECDRLSKVATDFLTFARPSEPQLGPISLLSVVEGAIAATEAELIERRVQLDWSPPQRLPRVWADAEAMRQVFVNLLTNAAQAIVGDGTIALEVRALNAEQGGPAVEVAVSDSGPGISPADMERIWTPFFSTKAKGTGLGLSIVRKTVEAHGGQVWAESRQSGGAVFRVRLPLGRPDKRQAAAATAAAISAGNAWRQLDLFASSTMRADIANELAATSDQGAIR